MPNKTSIYYLFPEDRIHDLPTWRFVLHFQCPDLPAPQALREAIARIGSLSFKSLQILCPLEELSIDPETDTLDIPIEVPEALRWKTDGLADYESDVWKLYANMVEIGFGDLYYEAVDWQEEEADSPSDRIFLSEQNPISGRSVVLEEEEHTAWLYLTGREDPRPQKATPVFARSAPVTTEEALKAAEAGQAPPLSIEAASEEAILLDGEESEFTFLWSPDGESVVVLRNGVALAMIVSGAETGCSKALAKTGFYGEPWDEQVYERHFGADA